MMRLAFSSLFVIFVAAGVAPVSGVDIGDWEERLVLLTPDDPVGYFELAEEVADVSTEVEDLELARHLFRLAGVLDSNRLGRSACLALADLAADNVEERRLLAMARMLDRQSGEPNWTGRDQASSVDSGAVVLLGEAFSYYRRGMGTRATEILDTTSAGALLSRHADLIGGEARFRENARRYRTGESPLKSNVEIAEMLSLELALLGHGAHTWSNELLLDPNVLLIEVDPDRLAETLDVDPARCIYRNGRWGTRDNAD